MHAATFELTAERPSPHAPRVPAALARFLRAPIEARTYANLLYLLLAFPLGLFYFVFLTVGFSLGLGLLIVWVGLLVLALAFAGVWGFAAFERQLAISLLGAEVPPMAPTAAPGRGVGQQIGDFLANPVTWKGMLFLFLKMPLGIATFTLLVTFLALSLPLLAAPLYYGWWPPAIFSIDGYGWVVDTLGEALICSAIGLGMLLVTLNLFNGVAFVWGLLASGLLGSRRWSLPAPPSGSTPPGDR